MHVLNQYLGLHNEEEKGMYNKDVFIYFFEIAIRWSDDKDDWTFEQIDKVLDMVYHHWDLDKYAISRDS